MSPAESLLQSAQSTARSPFEPQEQTPLLNRNQDLIPSWITSQAHTTSPKSLASPIPALVPPVSTRGVDTNPSKLISSKPNASTALPKPQRGGSAIAQAQGSAQAWVENPSTLSPERAIQSNSTSSSACESDETLNNLLTSESTLAQRLTTLDPLAPAFMQTLHTLATLRYYITAKRADLAAAQNPKYLNALAKATSIVQRDHHRLAREQAAKDREHNRRLREQAQDARYKQRQQDAELKYKRKLHLAEHALQREARADQRRKRAAEARDYRENYKTKYMEPNPHNQPKKSKASSAPSQHVAAPATKNSTPVATAATSTPNSIL